MCIVAIKCVGAKICVVAIKCVVAKNCIVAIECVVATKCIVAVKCVLYYRAGVQVPVSYRCPASYVMSHTTYRVVRDADALVLLVGVEEDVLAAVTLQLYTYVANAAAVRASVVGGKLQASLLRPPMVGGGGEGGEGEASCRHHCCVPPMVGGKMCVISACRSAILAHVRHCMKTRSMATEIIYNLAPHTKISAALQQFGIQDGDTNVLAVTVDFLPSEAIDSNPSEAIISNPSEAIISKTAGSAETDAIGDNFTTPNAVKLKNANLAETDAIGDNFTTPNAVKLKNAMEGNIVNIDLIDELNDKNAISKLYKLTKQELELYDIEKCCISRMASKGI
ncbi:hypothetical protein FHG87_019940 [Trinorchestia longiramus]|nr:hypothetical protein FHG87_019940 [Trinorchestia longiramus]